MAGAFTDAYACAYAYAYAFTNPALNSTSGGEE